MSARDIPEMCTDEAREQGCTCSIRPANMRDIDPPEPELDRDCPVHGNRRDPDDERDERRDMRDWVRIIMFGK